MPNKVPVTEVTIVAMGQIVQQITTIVTGVILARMLESSGYGIVNILRTMFTGIMTVAPLGLDLALLKYCGRQTAGARHVVVTVDRLRVIAAMTNTLLALTLGLGLGTMLMRGVYRYEHFDILLLITLAGLPFAADLGLMSAVYKARGRAGRYALMTIYLQPLLRLALIGIAALFWPTVMAVVAINTVQVVISSLAVAAHYRGLKAGEDQPAASLDQVTAHWSEVWSVLRESVWMALNLLVYGMMRFVDILMLGYYLPTRDVGEYAALTTIAQLVQVYPLAASQTLGPTISHLYHAGDLAGVRRTLGDYIYLASLVSGFVFGGVAIFGTRLDLVFGQSFHFQQVVSILLPFGYLLSATLAPTGFALSMTGRHRMELAILCVGGAALLLFCTLLIPRFGQAGAAMSVAASFLIINVIRFGYVSRVLGFVPGTWRDFLPPFVGLALAYAARSAVDLGFERNLFALILACATYGLFYLAACQLVLLRPATRDMLHGRLRQQAGRFLGRGGPG